MSARPEEVEPERVVVRDKRRIDPQSGELRAPADRPAAPGGRPEVAQATALDPRLADLETTLAERTGDLQRVTAEYANYRRRADRDRQAAGEAARAAVLTALLPVLDDVGRARAHGELDGAFRSVAEALESAVGGTGLVPFGAAGDPFDPGVHEALVHSYSAEVTGPTCVEVLQPGYRMGERVLRPARVVVAEPAEPDPPAEPSGSAEPGGAPDATAAGE